MTEWGVVAGTDWPLWESLFSWPRVKQKAAGVSSSLFTCPLPSAVCVGPDAGRLQAQELPDSGRRVCLPCRHTQCVSLGGAWGFSCLSFFIFNFLFWINYWFQEVVEKCIGRVVQTPSPSFPQCYHVACAMTTQEINIDTTHGAYSHSSSHTHVSTVLHSSVMCVVPCQGTKLCVTPGSLTRPLCS